MTETTATRDTRTDEPLPDDEQEQVEVERRVVSLSEELSHRHPKMEPNNYKSEHERASTIVDEAKFDPTSDVAVQMKHRRRRESGTELASERGKAAVDSQGMADTLNEGEAMLEAKKQVLGGRQRYSEPQPDI